MIPPHATKDVQSALSSPIDSDTLDRLHRSLERAAESEGLLDVSYSTVDTPIGSLLLAATRHGLVRVAFEVEGHDHTLESLASEISPRILRGGTRLDAASRQIEEYFAGTLRTFRLDLDFGLSHGFRQVVQRSLSTIAYGETRSYGEVAQFVGNPRAVRAVGSACATNPLPIVLPCHRVLRSNGSLGGYAGGVEVKALLLELEAGQL